MAYRLLLVNSVPEWGGGAELVLRELARRLPAPEFERLLLTGGDGALAAEFRSHGIETLVVPHGYFQSRGALRDYYLAGPLALRRLLRRRAIDLVHVNCDRGVRPLIAAARRVGVPVVVHLHDVMRGWFRPKMLRRLNEADRVVVISRALGDYAVAHGVRPELVRLVYNGVDPQPYREARPRRAEVRAALGLSEHEVAVGIVGQLSEHKGQQDAIRALAEPALQGVPIRLVLVGTDRDPAGSHRQRLERLVAEHGLDRRVTFLGFRRDVPLLLAGLDALCAPSRDEMFGLVLAEAMHAALPMVAYRSGALPEVMRGDVDGLLVEPGDIPGLAGALRRLAADPELRATHAANALERGARFTLDRFVAEMRDVYHDVLHTSTPAAQVG